MKILILFVILCTLISLFHLNGIDFNRSSAHFESYKAKWNKQYDPAEEMYRKMIFLRNMKEVEEHNNNPRSSYKKDVNFFADLSPL